MVTHDNVADEQLIEIRGNRGLYALVAVAAVTAASGYAYRASHGGSWPSWLMAVVLGLVAVVHAACWWDARAPRLVADAQGLRLRHGRTWTGTPWDEVETIEIGRGAGMLRDGKLRIQAGGEVQSLRYGVSARATSADLPASLRTLGAPVTADPVRPFPRHAAEMVEPADSPTPAAPPRLVQAGSAPGMEPSARRAVRADVRRDGPASVAVLALRPEPAGLPEAKALRGTSGRVGLVLEPTATDERPAVSETAVAAAPIDPYPTAPAERPVIGPELTASRERLRLSVDQVADRTRIRPHVIESIEVDDFVPCGGDFYARGHIRALARVLGLDPVPLLAAYDERYASAPINARRVFEAELGTGPTPVLRMTSGGPNWAALLGVVLVLAAVWGAAKLVTDTRQDASAPDAEPSANIGPTPPTLGPDRFAGVGGSALNRLRLSADGGASRVAVRDDAGELVWHGTLTDGKTHTVRVAGSATVVAADGGVVRANLNGHPRGPLGEPGESVQRVLGSDRSR